MPDHYHHIPIRIRGWDWTVIRQLETPLWRELFLLRLLLDDGTASTTVTDVDDVGEEVRRR